MLCGCLASPGDHAARDRFDELHQLCAAAGDKASLAIAMAGLVMDHIFRDRMREASQLASEAWALIESIGDATLTVGLSKPVLYAKGEAPRPDVVRWSQRVIDLADGDPSKGNFLSGSPLALATSSAVLAGIAWVVLDGATTCGGAWPWLAAPTPCPTPWSSGTPISRE